MPRRWPGALTPRILIVGSSLRGGGAETRFRLLLANLFDGQADGASVHVCEPASLPPGQRFHSLGWRTKADYPKAILALRRLLSSNCYDAALSLGLYPNVMLWAASRGLSRRPALIMTEITRPFTESTRFSNPMARIVRQPLYRWSYGGADLVAANSEDGVREIVAHYGADPARTRRAPNLVEVERVRAMADMHEPDAPNPAQNSLCMVARLDPIKRIDTLLRAVHGLSADLPWRVDIVGEGPARAALQALIGELRLSERVKLHGWRANPYPFIKAAAATALCSEYEGFSNTVLESMVIGTPVVTSFCSLDSRHMTAQGATLGFEIGDVAALRAHLENVLREPALRERLRANATRYAAPHHANAAVKQYEALVVQAIASRASAAR